MDLQHADLRFFVRESNRIEGILRAPTKSELQAHIDLLRLPRITVADLQNFVQAIAPGKPLRQEYGMNVIVGNHRPPPGGPDIAGALGYLLDLAQDFNETPFAVHHRYETLHPFMDGNGRSGRALWLWQMIHQHEAWQALQMGFLHLFYYQTLQHSNTRRAS